MQKESTIFSSLGLSSRPIFLAPLAGVSDHPFRRICSYYGADLTYVEMISAAALVQGSARTLQMLYRHPSESKLGVQVTARTAQEMGAAVAILAAKNFDTIDINMGCPVKKVVQSGCGSGILKDPERVYQTVKAAVANCNIPVSAKIRLGWDRESLNFLEVSSAIEEAGAAWITVHGRTRSEGYDSPVDLISIAKIKKSVKIPVIANGNIFTQKDVVQVLSRTCADGLMISRGALGNPWLFSALQQNDAKQKLSLENWIAGVTLHLQWQKEAYQLCAASAICMRKHLLWYVSGWPAARKLREKINSIQDFFEIEKVLADYMSELQDNPELEHRFEVNLEQSSLEEQETRRFSWDPKWDMDRQNDRGLKDECL